MALEPAGIDRQGTPMHFVNRLPSEWKARKGGGPLMLNLVAALFGFATAIMCLAFEDYKWAGFNAALGTLNLILFLT